MWLGEVGYQFSSAQAEAGLFYASLKLLLCIFLTQFSEPCIILSQCVKPLIFIFNCILLFKDFKTCYLFCVGWRDYWTSGYGNRSTGCPLALHGKTWGWMRRWRRAVGTLCPVTCFSLCLWHFASLPSVMSLKGQWPSFEKLSSRPPSPELHCAKPLVLYREMEFQ